MVSAKKLIQGSVIYMKKMRMSKRGFTLTEIIVVVAIIVIVASAAFVGVAVTLEKANKRSEDINKTHGRDPTGKDLFEADAWVEIDKWTKDAAKFFDINYYTPSDGDGSGSTTITPTPATGGGSGSGSSVTDTPTPPPSNTPTPSPSPTPTPEVSATPTTKPSGGRVGSTTGTTPADGSSVSGGMYGLTMSFNTPVKELTVYIPYDLVNQLNSNNGYQVTRNGHYYTVKIPDGTNNTSFGFSTSGPGDMGSLDASKVIVVSYVPA